MFGWWYSQGWLWTLRQTRRRLQLISQIFAVAVLIKTLFSPWKQIYSPTTFQNFIQHTIDNAVSRTIGTIVRGTILFWAGVLALLTICFGILSFIVWPFLPLMFVILLLLTLSGGGV
jgi:hypothetical protein